MKRVPRIIVVTFLVVLLIVPAVPGYAGEGTYTPLAGVDEIVLNVSFMYNEPCFASGTCGAWETLFKEGSKLLYDATQKQVRISKVRFYNNCPNANAKADVRIYNDNQGASANVGGLGKSGTYIRLSQVHKTVTTGTGNGNRGQFGLVHEMGHYVFGLKDEYQDKSGNETADAYCIDTSGTTASIMDGGTTVNPNNRRTEFCYSGNHRAGHTEQDQKRTINGVDYENTDSWTFLAAFVKHYYNATLTVPTSAPTSDTTGHVNPTFEYYNCGVRAAICIDRSGSMDGAPLTLAKSGASVVVDLTEQTDQLAVTSYDDTAMTNYALALMTSANKTAAKNAIDAIVVGGLTNIGGGLQQSLNEITSAGQPVSNEVILLLSDGYHNTGTHPDSVLPAIKARGVTVYTVGLGSVDSALMSRIASETGGSYYYASTEAELKGHFQQIFNQLRNNGMIERLDGDMGGTLATELNMASRQVYLDGFSNSVTFSLSWDKPTENMNFTLKRPNGTTVNPSDTGVDYLYDSANAAKIYRVANPAVGTWTVDYSYNGTQLVRYSMQVHAGASKASLNVALDEDHYVYPSPMRLEATLSTENHVGGANVTTRVKRPNGSTVDLSLYDDGSWLHGDYTANDGVYSTFFVNYAGDGNYTFDVTAQNNTGYTVADVEDGGNFISQPVPKFTRKASATTVLSGAPAAQNTIYLPMISNREGGPLGFDSQFKGSYAPWTAVHGAWTVDSEYYSAYSIANESVSAAYPTVYGNFDYQVRMKRSGSCTSCANRIMVRSTPQPVDATGRWYQYYIFQYTTGGSVSVFKAVAGGSSVALLSWASSSAVAQGDAWNTLRVVANGSAMNYYVNGSLVWSGSDTSMSEGQVGFGMYSDAASNRLMVDWATLTPITFFLQDLPLPPLSTPTVISPAAGMNENMSTP